jgi:hypothetical protein
MIYSMNLHISDPLTPIRPTFVWIVVVDGCT